MRMDGRLRNLWVQYEDGLPEPVRGDGDITRKSRDSGDADWWVVAKDRTWRPEHDGFTTTDNHPGPPQKKGAAPKRSTNRPDPADIMADLASGGDGGGDGTLAGASRTRTREADAKPAQKAKGRPRSQTSSGFWGTAGGRIVTSAVASGAKCALPGALWGSGLGPGGAAAGGTAGFVGCGSIGLLQGAVKELFIPEDEEDHRHDGAEHRKTIGRGRR